MSQFPATVKVLLVATNMPPLISMPFSPISHVCEGVPTTVPPVHTMPSAVIFSEAEKLPEVFVKIPSTSKAPPWLRMPPSCSTLLYVRLSMVLWSFDVYKTLESVLRVKVPSLVQVPPDRIVTLPDAIVSIWSVEIVKSSPPASSVSLMVAVKLNTDALELQKILLKAGSKAGAPEIV